MISSLGSRLFNVILIVMMLLIVFVTLFPFYHIFIVSLSNGNAVLRGEVTLPGPRASRWTPTSWCSTTPPFRCT